MKMEIRLPGNDVVEASFEGHTVRTAQDGSAPAPFDLFLASLGTCAGYYVSRFCRERGIATDGIRITQVSERDEETRRVHRVEIEIELPASFPERYREAVIRAAGQCSVKKHLASPPLILMRTVESSLRSR